MGMPGINAAAVPVPIARLDAVPITATSKDDGPDLEEIAHRQVETDLEQQQQHPDPRQDVEVRIGAEELESLEAGQIPEQHAGEELSQDGRLADAGGQVSAEQGGRDDDREAQGEPAQLVERSRGAARKHQPSAETEKCGA